MVDCGSSSEMLASFTSGTESGTCVRGPKEYHPRAHSGLDPAPVILIRPDGFGSVTRRASLTCLMENMEPFTPRRMGLIWVESRSFAALGSTFGWAVS